MTKKILSILLIFTMLTPLMLHSTNTLAAESFEATLLKFPESYREDLIKLHNTYPNWTFEPLITNIKFDDAVKAETGKISLVSNSSIYSDMLKSKKSGDYNYSSGSYVVKDSGFVCANEYTVSHFLDPRNFLTVEGIFQFEKLSFDSSITVSDVEKALAGTYMANAYANYYDKNGNYVKVSEKYSTIIYNAGKKYNVNPCFLASRIVNETGANGSSTTKGTNSSYPGIYNFYNIGANDGGNAALKGLAYAASGSSYGRPWTSPKKAIYGGAEFNSTAYISVGQYTNYLQRFNVNPDATNKLYSHQWMTNTSAAAEIAYKTYLGYKSAGTLKNKKIISIPVFKSMSGLNTPDEKISAFDGLSISGTLTTTSKLRTEPNVNSDLITTIPAGKTVSLLETVKTNSLSPEAFLMYPMWAKIQYKVDSKTYTGYIYANFFKPTTQVVVKPGTYSPVVAKSNSSLKFKYISNDVRVAEITSDNKINFLKEGNVLIYAYDSLGHFMPMYYSVQSSLTGMSTTAISVSNITTNSADISYKKSSKSTSTKIFVVSSDGTIVKNTNTKEATIKASSLQEYTNYYIYSRGINGNYYYPLSGVVSFITLYNNPAKPSSLKATQSDDLLSVNLSWKKSSYASAYNIYALNSATGKYETVGSTVKTSFNFEDERAVLGTSFKVRAYRVIDNKMVYSSYSSVLEYTPADYVPDKVKNFTSDAQTSSSISLKWDSVKNATAYYVYKYNPETKVYDRIKKVTDTKYKVSNLEPLTEYKFKVKPIVSVYSKNYYAAATAFTQYTLPSSVTTIKASSIKNTSLVLSWNAINKATGYRVYIYDTDQKSYVKLADVTTTKYTVKSLTANTSYKFKVKPYSTVNSKRIYAVNSSAFTVKTIK